MNRPLIKVAPRVAGTTLLTVFCSAAVGFATIIPSSRLINWKAGVPGGIPTRTTIYRTLYPTNTAADISAACQSCPSNQVVFLSAGTYYLNDSISWYYNLSSGNGVTLRGAGPTNTILIWTNTAYIQAPIQIMGPDRYGNGYPDTPDATNYIRNWTSGYAQGATNITIYPPQPSSLIGTHSELKAGTILVLDQLNDWFVNNVGSDGGFQVDAAELRNNGTRAQQQYVRVTAVNNGTNLTISPGLYMPNIQAALSPQIWWWGASTEMCGVEDLQVNTANSLETYGIFFWSCYACWVKNVQVYKQDNSAVATYNCKNIEIRDSFFNQAKNYGSGSYGANLQLAGDCLVENNIFYFISTPLMLAQGSSGNVLAYNFMTNGIYYTYSNPWMAPSVNPHYVHNCMNLFEGNYGNSATFDFTHGSSSHQTLLRNRFTGWDGRPTQTANTFAINLMATNWWINLVGNVLGTPGYHTNYQISTAVPMGNNPQTIYKFGFVDDSGSPANGDPNALATVLRHGNYDVVTSTNGGVVWDPTIADHTIPNSLYLSAKPSWWGNSAWPPFDPLNPATAAPTNLPAGYRFVFGVNPNPGNRPPVAVSAGSPQSGAAPLPVSFSSAGSYDPEGVQLTFNWAFGDGATSTAANPSHTYSTPGAYTAQLQVSDGTNVTAATPITITVFNPGSNQPPVAVASASPVSGAPPLTVTFSSVGSYDPEGASLTFNWVFGDGTASATANPTHIYQAAGNFSAQLTVSDGTNSTAANPIQITVGGNTNGLVAAYGFNEGSGSQVSDASGNGNNGTITGASWNSSGEFGRALSFGLGALVSVNDSPSLDLTTGMTLEAWVYPTALSGWENILIKPQGSSGICYVLQGSSPSGPPSFAASFSAANVQAPSALPLNSWSHVAGTYDGGTMSLYVNGVLVASQSQTGVIGTSTDPLTIGGNSGGENWQGSIDEVRIYNRALSASEIQSDMNAPVLSRPAPPSGLRVVGH